MKLYLLYLDTRDTHPRIYKSKKLAEKTKEVLDKRSNGYFRGWVQEVETED